MQIFEPKPLEPRGSCAAMLQRALEDSLREETGLRGEIGALLAARILAGLRRALGGEAVYVPKPSKDERNARIRQQFTGGWRGLERVAWAGLSERQIYRIAGKRGTARAGGSF